MQVLMACKGLCHLLSALPSPAASCGGSSIMTASCALTLRPELIVLNISYRPEHAMCSKLAKKAIWTGQSYMILVLRMGGGALGIPRGKFSAQDLSLLMSFSGVGKARVA